MKSKWKVALALGSGGARGWAHIGVIRALQRRGIEPDIITGTSIGAMAGAMLAAGVFETFVQELSQLSTLQLTRFFTEFHFPQSGLLGGKPIVEWLSRPHLLGDRTFDDLEKPFAAVATDLHRGCAVTLNSGSVVQAVRASISIPGIFDPVRLGNTVLVDGGIVEPIPIQAARALGANVVIAVDINTGQPEDCIPDALEEPNKIPNVVTTLLQTMRVIENTSCNVVLERDTPEVLILPEVGHFNPLDFWTGKQLIAAGEAAVDAVQKELEHWL